MGRRTNLVGKKFTRLTVIEYSHTRKNKAYWKCRCDCGNITTVVTGCLNDGNTKSCGCIAKENLRLRSKNNSTHGMSKHPLYKVWQNMNERCKNPNSVSFYNYGGRGIYVCDEWQNEPTVFIKWAIDNGHKKGLQLDRKDNYGPYAPWNCHFVTTKENARNKRKSRYATINGETKPIAEWAEEAGMSCQALTWRIDRKWPEEKLLIPPFFSRNEVMPEVSK